MRLKWTLRDLFWLVLLCAVACPLVVYSGHRITPALVEMTIQTSLVAAGAVLAGRYVSKAPFSAGLVVGMAISLYLREHQGSLPPVSYLLQEWILPKGTADLHVKLTVAIKASVLVYGILAGVIAVGVSRQAR